MAIKKKKIGMEDLAVMVKQNSEDINSLAVMTKNGFDAVDKRLDGMDVKMATKEELGRVHYDLSHRIENLELKLSSYASNWAHDYDHLDTQVQELDRRVNKIEDKVTK